ncbi:MAG: minor capsid protein [Candidatus Paceibacterota bacterium]
MCALFTINLKTPTITEHSNTIIPEVSRPTTNTSAPSAAASSISVFSHGSKICNGDGINSIFEEFRGKVFDDKIKFRGDILKNAIDHPFNFEVLLKMYKKFGLVTAIVDKYVDFIVGNGFTIKADDANVQKVLDEFVKDNHFESLLRKWIKEALLTGNSFMELGGATSKSAPMEMKVLCSRNMFVARNDKGKLERYYQYNPTLFGESPIPFEPHQIAHLAINQIGDDAYGNGIIYPMLHIINDFIKARKDMHTILKRKANSPLWAKLGDAEKGIVPTAESVEAFGKTMEFMNEKQEWSTDPYVDFKVIDFGNVGDKFTAVLEHDLEMISVTSQTPEVLLGYGSIPEGLAAEQKEAFEKRAHSFQIDIEKIVEEDIFARVTAPINTGANIDFVWGKPSKKDVNEEVIRITEMLKVFTISDDLRFKLEDRLYELLELGEREESIEQEKARKDAQALPAVPGSANSPGARFPVRKQGEPAEKPKAKEVGSQMIEHCTCKDVSPDKLFEDLSLDYSIKEWVGFDYNEFKNNILSFVDKDTFPFLAAKDQFEEEIGKLSDTQVEKLRKIIRRGFDNGESINKIATSIKNEVRPGDLLAVKDGEVERYDDGRAKIVASASVRPYTIARTETVRAAAEGALMTYKDRNVEKVQWIAAISDRTCPTCLGLSNKVLPLSEARNMLPAHVACRCAWIPVIE